jgi:type I restriction-modification system DNA methylase subunit
MVAPQKIEQAINRVKDQRSFVQGLLTETLEWPIPDPIEAIPDIAYGWTEAELCAQELERDLLEGQAWQIQALRHGQPWGIFLLEFRSEAHFTARGGLTGATGALRKVLRGLVPSRRRDPGLQSWNREHLLFLCTHNYRQFRVAYFKAPRDTTQVAPLSAFGWNHGDTHVRTLCECNLPALGFPADGGADSPAWVRQWAGAFDVEAVTKRFFGEYRQVFEQVEESVKRMPKGEARRLYTQRLFNRLMFLYFIQRKGWLSFRGDKNYLRALFNAASAAQEDFLNERLYWSFFYGLNTAGENFATHSDARLRERRGEVPFLNGGLFDLEDDYDVRDKVKVPNDSFAAILGLFERYNFTVSESTPLDIEVAVDPEMLGKVFEELVTGRHETGSYYTPRPIVAFMCRESLKHYLAQVVRDETAIARFVDDNDPTALPDPEAVLDALKRVKVCDPACGSGAYLLGMMHELLRLRQALFATRGLDSATIYERKLDIILNNLYGVDIDLFAVNIAKLRLWLSLTVDFEGPKPPALPNLDFKIERGDSLTAPDPQELPDLFRNQLVERADRLADLKGQFLSTYKAEKKKLFEQIHAEEAELRASLQQDETAGSVDWRVAFAEVFKNGGFDIALANPPYVRMELFKEAKPTLRRNFPHVHAERADLYVYFYARTHQILRQDGAACFISSNKWLRAGYGEKLREFLLDNQAFHLIVDFGDQPVFQATAYPAVFLWQKMQRGSSSTTWAEVTDLDACYAEGIRDHVTRIAHLLPASQFGKGKPRLAAISAVEKRSKMQHSGQSLGELVRGRICMGIKPGLKKAFIIDQATRQRLIAADSRNEEVIKPVLEGDDIRRYEIQFRQSYLIYLKHGVDIRRYPAVRDYMKPFKEELEGRATQQEWYELQQPQAAYIPFFEKAKIIYPDISKEIRFAMDTVGYYSSNTTYFIALEDWFLLGILNSSSMQWYVSEISAEIRGGYMRFFGQYLENLPIPSATAKDRHSIAALAKQSHQLHSRRRKRAEQFLIDVGVDPCSSTSRNPLEQPWTLSPEEFSRRVRNEAITFTNARDETASLTEEIAKIESEIDARVAALYGL